MTSLLFFLISFFATDAAYFKTSNGMVIFESNAALEKIKAKSNHLRGVVNTNNNTFSFAIQLNSFQGFNSELQLEHYNENYVESNLYKEATFKGNIIENVNWLAKGKYHVRAKGLFGLHGEQKIETIQATIEHLDETTCTISANFSLNLSDYNIKIPRIVHKKLAENIDIQINATLKKITPSNH
jgi:polyisoprenoid-binding protein YceI